MKIAVIGCGAISPLHVKGITEAGLQVAALCDIDLTAATALKQRYGLSCSLYTDYKEMYMQEKPDSVHICTPHYLHCEMIEFFLKHDVNVMCEKPIAISIQELERIKTAVSASSAKLGVCLQNRYLESTVAAKELLKGAKTKSIFALVPWQRSKEYYASGGWRGKKRTEGGGLLINQAIHTLDLLLFMYGDVKNLQASVNNRSLQGVIDVEDTAEGLIEFESGEKAVFFASNALGVNYPVEIRIMTDKNDIRLQAEKLFVDGKETVSGAYHNTPGKHYWGNGHCLLISDFYDTLSKGGQVAVGFEAGYKSLKLVMDIYKKSGFFR